MEKQPLTWGGGREEVSGGKGQGRQMPKNQQDPSECAMHLQYDKELLRPRFSPHLPPPGMQV